VIIFLVSIISPSLTLQKQINMTIYFAFPAAI